MVPETQKSTMNAFEHDVLSNLKIISQSAFGTSEAMSLSYEDGIWKRTLGRQYWTKANE